MPNIGELFIGIGVKGADKTIGALSAAKSGLESLKDTSFETKAALVGAFYALEQLFAKSGEFGTNLSNLNTILGGGFNKTIQEYRYAAQQVGISNEQLDGSFLKIQDTLGKVSSGLIAAPAGLGELSRVTGKIITNADVANYARHPEEFIQLVQTYAQLEKNPVKRENTLSLLPGVSQLQVGLDKGVFNPKVFAEAQQYISSDKQIKQLDQSRAAWENLGSSIQKVFHDLTATHGKEIAEDIKSLVKPAKELIEQLDKLSTSVGLFEKLRLALKGIADIVGIAVSGFKELSLLTSGDPAKQDQVKKDAINLAADPSGWGAVLGSIFIVFGDKVESIKGTKGGGEKPTSEESAKYQAVLKSLAPTNGTQAEGLLNGLLGPPPGGARQPPKVDIHQNLNFQHPGTDAKKTGENVKKASNEGVTGAMRQSPALAGGW